MIGSLIGFVIVAFVAGVLARALVPGKDTMSWGQTILLGGVGSFVGGFLGRILGRDSSDGVVQTAGLIGSVIGAVIVLILYKKYGKSIGQGKR